MNSNFLGDLSDFNSNEKFAASVDISSWFQAGDYTTSLSVTIAAYLGDDPNASAMLIGATAFAGGVLTQVIGGGVPGVTYRIGFLASTAFGSILYAYVHIYCAPVN